MLIGTVVNAIAIVVGATVGLCLKGIAKPTLRDSVVKGLGLCVLVIGIKDALTASSMMCVIVSVAVGTIAGELLHIEDGMTRASDKLRSVVARGDGGDSFGEGFVAATLIYCTGAMAVMGALDGGIRGDHATLFAKSLLDGITAVFFAASFGFGVALSAVPVFVYQGAIALLAGLIAPLLTSDMLVHMSAVGGVLVAAIGLNLTLNAKIKVGNMLVATFVPIIYFALGLGR